MERKIYAIRDRIAQDLVGHSMYVLMVFRTDAEATRYFADAILDPKSILAKHPGDYELIHLGDLTPEGYILETVTTANIIITGSALVNAMTPTPDDPTEERTVDGKQYVLKQA